MNDSGEQPIEHQHQKTTTIMPNRFGVRKIIRFNTSKEHERRTFEVTQYLLYHDSEEGSDHIGNQGKWRWRLKGIIMLCYGYALQWWKNVTLWGCVQGRRNNYSSKSKKRDFQPQGQKWVSIKNGNFPHRFPSFLILPEIQKDKMEEQNERTNRDTLRQNQIQVFEK